MKPTVLLAACLLLNVIVFCQEPVSISSELKNVTVYRSGAEMNHTANLNLKSGQNDIIIEGIANAIDLNSVQISCPNSVAITKIEFSNNYLKPETPSAKEKLLSDSIETIRKEIEKMDVAIQVNNDLIEVLRTNKEIKGSQSNLSIAELMKLMDYFKAKSTELQNELSSLNERKIKKQQLIAKLNEQLNEEKLKNTKISGRLMIGLQSATQLSTPVTVTYITPNAYWTPNYDIKVENIKSPVKIMYKSNIVQTTGLEWKKVKMSVSTSVPSQYGVAPTLTPFYVGFIQPNRRLEQSLMGKSAGVVVNKENQNLEEVVVSGYGNPSVKIRGSASLNGDNQPLYVVDGVPLLKPEDFKAIDPSSIKSVNVLKDAAATSVYGSRGANGVILVTLKHGMDDYVSANDKELNTVFEIDLPYDVPTNGKAQTVTLKEYEIAANYNYVAVPKLDKDAFLLANITDWEKLSLIAGNANIIFEGTYVGKTFIDPASVSDTLRLTLGRDKRVAIKKEKLTDFSSVKFLGSNKKQQFTYEITVRNNKKDAVTIHIKDQFPVSTDKDIEIELTDDGKAEVNNETGALDWNLTLNPGEIKKLRFSYSVKYPKVKLINL